MAFRAFALPFLLLAGGCGEVSAGPGDTTVVQTFTFGSPQNAKFLFPPVLTWLYKRQNIELSVINLVGTNNLEKLSRK